MKNAFYAVVLLSFTTSLIGCPGNHLGKGSYGTATSDDTSPPLSAKSGKATFHKKCEIELSMAARTGEKEIELQSIIDGKDGLYQLIDLSGFAAGVNDRGDSRLSVSGHAKGPFATEQHKSINYDDVAQVDCHNTSTVDQTTTAVMLNLDLPNEINTRDGAILSTAYLILNAVGGRVGARVRVKETDKNLRSYLAEDGAVISEKLTAATDAEGHLILRHEARIHLHESPGSTVYHVRAVYVLRKH